MNLFMSYKVNCSWHNVLFNDQVIMCITFWHGPVVNGKDVYLYQITIVLCLF